MSDETVKQENPDYRMAPAQAQRHSGAMG